MYGDDDNYEIDVDTLRHDMKEEAGEINELYDMDSLREDMLEESNGAFFVGGFGGASFEAEKIKNASDEELIKMAERKGIHVNRYRK